MNDMTQSCKDEVRNFFWRNYLSYCIEGGFFMGGLTFVAANTVMPAMISRMGGPDWLVSLMPVMMLLGFSWPPLLVAHHVEQLYWLKPFLMITSLIQRLPYLAAAIFLYCFADTHPLMSLTLAAASPFICGSIGGLSFCAFVELVAKVIPANRRASGSAIRRIITATTGLLAGGIIKTVLQEHPGAQGLGILHFYTFGFFMISYFVFAMIRETKPLPPHPDKPTRSFAENMRSLPELLRDQPGYRRFVRSKFLGISIFIPAPFLALHALSAAGREPEFLGTLVIAQMLGSISGHCLAGWIGDRHGAKIPIVLARIALILLCILALFCRSATGFTALFALFGLGLGLNEVGEEALSMEITDSDRRPTCIALSSAVSFIGMLLAAGLSTLLKSLTGIIQPALILAAFALTAGLITALRIEEPRQTQPAHS